MPSKLSRGLLIFALLIVAVVSWQWIDEREIEPAAANNTLEMAETQSDYYLENFEIKNISNKSDRSTNANNTITPADRRLNIKGQSLSHHHIDGYSIIENPRVSLQSTDNGQWQARASSGTVSANFDVLDLQGNVELTHDRSSANPQNTTADNGQIRVDTNSLTIDAGTRTITSTEPVQVEGNGWNYNARAMDAEIDRGTLSFTSGVEAQFESPNKR